MEFVGRIENLESAVWGHVIFIPKEISDRIIESKNKRVVCTVNGSESYATGLLAGKAGYFVNINKEHLKTLKLTHGDEVSVKLEPEESKYGMPVCEEFHEFINQDEIGSAFFHALTPGKQRNLIYIANKPKSSEIRIKKSLVIFEHLKNRNGNLDFKILNEDFKRANQK